MVRLDTPLFEWKINTEQSPLQVPAMTLPPASDTQHVWIETWKHSLGVDKVNLWGMSNCVSVKRISAVLMRLAHIYRQKKEAEIRWERKATIHAKLMVKDVHRHTPAKAALAGYHWNSAYSNEQGRCKILQWKDIPFCVGGNLLDSCWGTLAEYGCALNLAWW